MRIRRDYFVKRERWTVNSEQLQDVTAAKEREERMKARRINTEESRMIIDKFLEDERGGGNIVLICDCETFCPLHKLNAGPHAMCMMQKCETDKA